MRLRDSHTRGARQHTRVENGYSGVRDVTRVPPPLDDTMQTFILAETFKYLYLLYSPSDVLPLDQYVFNTEAHPLGRLDLATENDAAWLDNLMAKFH